LREIALGTGFGFVRRSKTAVLNCFAEGPWAQDGHGAQTTKACHRQAFDLFGGVWLTNRFVDSQD
jgi:hypothetical protein